MGGIIERLKQAYRTGNVVTRLIFINVSAHNPEVIDDLHVVQRMHST